MKTFPTKVMGDFKTNRNRQNREPLRTLQEMAEEFSVSVGSLTNLLRHRDGPKAKLDFRNASVARPKYYSPSEMRKWWKEINQ